MAKNSKVSSDYPVVCGCKRCPCVVLTAPDMKSCTLCKDGQHWRYDEAAMAEKARRQAVVNA